LLSRVEARHALNNYFCAKLAVHTVVDFLKTAFKFTLVNYNSFDSIIYLFFIVSFNVIFIV